MEVSARERIARHVDDVYEFVAEAAQQATWAPGTVSMELMGGDPGVVGAMYRRAVSEGSGQRVYRHALVEALPDQLLTFHSESEDFSDAATYRYEFSAADEGATWVVLRAESEVRGTQRLLLPVLRWAAARGARRHLQRLRLALEAEGERKR